LLEVCSLGRVDGHAHPIRRALEVGLDRRPHGLGPARRHWVDAFRRQVQARGLPVLDVHDHAAERGFGAHAHDVGHAAGPV
jgi:hypothetical protein